MVRKLFGAGIGAVLVVGMASAGFAAMPTSARELRRHEPGKSTVALFVPASWLTYRNDERGLTLHYPPDWFVAPGNLTPNLGMANLPWEIVSLGTYPGLDPSDHNCAQIPVNALERLGPEDAFVSVSERRPSLHEQGVPRRPRHFGPTTGLDGAQTDVVGCLSVRPAASFRWIHFTGKGREFYVIVAIGDQASEQRRADTYRVLDTMEISRPRAGDSLTAPLRTCDDTRAAKGFTGLPRLSGAAPRSAIRFVGYPSPATPLVRTPEYYGRDGRFHLLKVLVVAAPNTTVTVVVPRAERGKVALLYDVAKLDQLSGTTSLVEMSRGDSAVTFQGCDDPDVGFPGYFLVDGPRCVRLDIHVRHEISRVSLPFGVHDC